jgi:ribose 5-phosphate isomerase B
MKIAFACDHRGFEVKDKVISFLKQKNFDVTDFGTYSSESCDYPDFIFKAAEAVQKKECDLAIGVCYTGIGSSIAANKVPGVRASLVHSVKEAELTRAHNDSNMIILGSGFLDEKLLLPIIETWLKTPFEGGRHDQRVNKIKSYEQKHCK